MRTLRGLDQPVVGVDIKPSAFTDRVGSIADRDFVRDCMAGIDAVLHTATLHKPHVATHTRRQFVETNVTGTLNLLEEAVATGVRAFVFTSTTSTFGDALRPPAGEPAAWITEAVTPVPKNIYGVTKTAAEDLCRLFHRNQGLPCLILRTSRFFPEPDDDEARRTAFDDANLKVCELLYRRVDTEDVVQAHLLALERAAALGFDRFIISATTPFTRDDLPRLRRDPAAVVAAKTPEFRQVFDGRGWRMLGDIERVYVNLHARKRLGWNPRYDFRRALRDLEAGRDYRSPLARAIGAKGYHDERFTDGIYPTETHPARNCSEHPEVKEDV